MRTVEAERLLLREHGRLAPLYNRRNVTSLPVVWKQLLPVAPVLRGRHTLDLACGRGPPPEPAHRLGARASGVAGKELWLGTVARGGAPPSELLSQPVGSECHVSG